jgi:hypothetical protein
VACIKVVDLVLDLASPSYLLTCCLVKLVENLNRLFTPLLPFGPYRVWHYAAMQCMQALGDRANMVLHKVVAQGEACACNTWGETSAVQGGPIHQVGSKPVAQ